MTLRQPYLENKRLQLKGTLRSCFLMWGGPFIILGREPLRAVYEYSPEGRKVDQEKAIQGSVWLRGLSTEYFYDQVPVEIEK